MSFAHKWEIEIRNSKLENRISKIEMKTLLQPVAAWLVRAALAPDARREAARP